MITRDIDISVQQSADLASLLSIYSIVQERINNYENRASDASIVNFSVIVVLLGINFLDLTTLTDAGIIWFIFPLITMSAHYQFSFYARFSAVLQGYSAYLEDLMNNYHTVPFFIWNKAYVNEFFTPKKFRTNSLSVMVFSSFTIAPNIYAFYKIFSFYITFPYIGKIFTIILLLIYIVITIILIVDCADNDKKRAEAQLFPKKITHS